MTRLIRTMRPSIETGGHHVYDRGGDDVFLSMRMAALMVMLSALMSACAGAPTIDDLRQASATTEFRTRSTLRICRLSEILFLGPAAGQQCVADPRDLDAIRKPRCPGFDDDHADLARWLRRPSNCGR